MLTSLKGEETKRMLLCIHSFPSGDPTKPAANIAASPMSPSLPHSRLWVLFYMPKVEAPRGTECTGHFGTNRNPASCLESFDTAADLRQVSYNLCAQSSPSWCPAARDPVPPHLLHTAHFLPASPLPLLCRPNRSSGHSAKAQRMSEPCQRQPGHLSLGTLGFLAPLSAHPLPRFALQVPKNSRTWVLPPCCSPVPVALLTAQLQDVAALLQRLFQALGQGDGWLHQYLLCLAWRRISGHALSPLLPPSISTTVS